MMILKALRQWSVRILCSLLFLPALCYAANINEVIAFGDSLSDSGNLYKATKAMGVLDPNMPAVPKTPPYWQGHFSNGYTWVEHLALKLGLDLSDQTQFNDYAFGGSWVEGVTYSHESFPPNLSTQVDWYIKAHHSSAAQSTHLFTIWDGANDYLKGRDDVDAATTRVVSVMKQSIERLINEAGAENFMILNLPDLGRTPYAYFFPQLQAQLSQITLLHNNKLADMVTELRLKYPTIKFMTFDIFTSFNTLLNTGKINGVTFSKTNEPCYTGSYAKDDEKAKQGAALLKSLANIDIDNNPDLKHTYYRAFPMPVTVCSNQSNYVFWDVLHTTTAVNTVIATMAKDIVESNGL